MFGLFPKKGQIAPGSDADIVLYDPKASYVISAETHHMNVDYSAYEGKQITGHVVRTISRGADVVVDDEFVGHAGHGTFQTRKTNDFIK
jgi:dihydropyrimidinase